MVVLRTSEGESYAILTLLNTSVRELKQEIAQRNVPRAGVCADDMNLFYGGGVLEEDITLASVPICDGIELPMPAILRAIGLTTLWRAPLRRERVAIWHRRPGHYSSCGKMCGGRDSHASSARPARTPACRRRVRRTPRSSASWTRTAPAPSTVRGGGAAGGGRRAEGEGCPDDSLFDTPPRVSDQGFLS